MAECPAEQVQYAQWGGSAPTLLPVAIDLVRGDRMSDSSDESPEHAELAMFRALSALWWREDENGCWIWRPKARTNGYGQITVDGRKRVAHRYVYTLIHGPIDDSLDVMHRCDVRDCVNPAHLTHGTRADNMRDMAEKDRSTRGERSASAKLTDAQAAEIRSRWAAGGVSQADLGREYGVRDSTINRIVQGRSFRHLLGRAAA
jgi:hypothetical protein